MIYLCIIVSWLVAIFYIGSYLGKIAKRYPQANESVEKAKGE